MGAKNLVTEKEIPLKPPWEIKAPAKSMTFDDVRFESSANGGPLLKQRDKWRTPLLYVVGF